MLFLFVTILVSFLGIILSIAFFTLFERKILGLTQTRLGPNKALWGGLFQPLLDGIKLLMKNFLFPQFTNSWGFMWAPLLFFVLMYLLWMLMMNFFFFGSFSLGVYFLLSILGISIYTSLLTGVNSFSKFALIGGVRSSAQTISYEICLAFFIFSILVLWESLNLSLCGFLFWPVLLFWFVLLLSESNRAPFDFAEGESELISGFNVEFSSAGFVFLFLGEYGMIIFLSFFGGMIFGSSASILGILLSFLTVLVRSTLPRFRYDFLMGLYWFYLLPISICFFWLMTFF